MSYTAAQFGPDYHDVRVRISGSFVRDVPNWLLYLPVFAAQVAAGYADAGKNADGVAAILDSKGWIVSGVSDVSGWTGDYIFEVRAVVNNFYSDANVQSQIQTDLAGFFNVNGITVLSPPHNGVSYTQTPPNTPPPNYQPPTPPAANTTGQPNSGTGLPTLPTSSLDAFAASLGVSAPIAIVGGLILVVLLTRR